MIPRILTMISSGGEQWGRDQIYPNEWYDDLWGMLWIANSGGKTMGHHQQIYWNSVANPNSGWTVKLLDFDPWSMSVSIGLSR